MEGLFGGLCVPCLWVLPGPRLAFGESCCKVPGSWKSENITRRRQALLWSFPSFMVLGGQIPPAERSELILPVWLPMCKSTCYFLTDLHISTTDGEVEDSSSTGLETAQSERVKKLLVSIWMTFCYKFATGAKQSALKTQIAQFQILSSTD